MSATVSSSFIAMRAKVSRMSRAAAIGSGLPSGPRAGAVSLAEGVAASNERHRLLVIHRHAGEGLADVPRRSDRIGVAVRTLGIDVDQAHLHCGEGILQVARVRLLAVVVGVDDAVPRDAGRAVRVADVAAEPFLLAAPIDVLIWLPDILATPGETKCFETHRFQGDVPGEDHQVGPGNLPAVLLFDRPEQSARLVETHIVGPAVEGCEALAAVARAAATVTGAVGAGAVPRHAD